MAVVGEDSAVRVVQLDVAGGIVSNAYLVVCQETGDCALIDAPGEAEVILRQLGGTHPRYILITHNHFDHLGALEGVRPKLGVPVAAHHLDLLPSPPDRLLEDGDTLAIGKIELKVLHTPGHTAGSLSFVAGKHLISGDTLFPGGPGRTGSPQALKQIIESIASKLLVLPDETRVYSGHGEPTVLEKERAEIAEFNSRSHNPDLCGDVLWLSS